MARGKSRDEKLFGAAVLRRSFELRGPAEAAAFRAVYEGVLRDLQVTDDEVGAFLAAHGPRVDEAIGRGRGS